eukprot:Nk52_evm10s621 gene=Nk52_evmTU10s621
MDRKAKRFVRNESLRGLVRKIKSFDEEANRQPALLGVVAAAQENQRRASNSSPSLLGSANGENAPLLDKNSEKKGNDLSNMVLIMKSNYVSVLLLIIPFALAGGYMKWGDNLVFALNFIAIMPLAWLLGKSTEELAIRTNQTIGGLMNATFGNAVEIIMSITALRSGLIRVVQTSLLGSILSNLLLVLGMCFIAGGYKYKSQTFNSTGASTFCSLLTLACLGVILPSAFNMTVSPHPTHESLLELSHWTAVLLLVVYLFYLFFQLKTHSELFEDGEEEEEEALLSVYTAVGVLLGVTILVAICSEFLVDSIEGVAKTAGLNQAFIGTILLPIVGNAAEHVTAITCATRNKMDLSIGVAVGSSTQIALFVIPVITIIGWAIGADMTLDFHPFETIVLFVSVIITNAIIVDGESNWLEGMMLLIAYFVIAVAFFVYPQ